MGPMAVHRLSNKAGAQDARQLLLLGIGCQVIIVGIKKLARANKTALSPG